MKKRTKILLAIGIPLAAILVLAVLHYIAGAVAARRFEEFVKEKIAESRAAGEPLLLADLAPEPIPDSENAALIYQKAFDALNLPEDKSPDGEKWSHIESGDAKLSENMEFVEKILAQNSEALALIEKASQMPKCQFKKDYTGNPWDMEFPEISPLVQTISLVKVKATFELAQGNTAEACKWTFVALAIPRACKDDPFLLSHLLSLIISNKALESAQELLKSEELSEGQMDKLRKAFAQQYTRPAWAG